MIPKFRAYNKKRKTISDVLGWQLYGSATNEPLICCSVIEDTNTHIYEPMNEFELMQWTGLVDSEGKEAYQDYLYYFDGKIFRLAKYGMLWFIEHKEGRYQIDDNIISELKEVGCYWTNPDLLEGAERE